MDAMHTENENLRCNVEKIAGGEPYLAQTTGEIQGSKEELKQQAVHRLLMNP